MFKDIYLVDDRSSLIEDKEILVAEERLEIVLPKGYKEFLLALGKGTYCGLIDIPSPDELNRVSTDFRWKRGLAVLGEEDISNSIEIASTIDCDKIIYCPGSKRELYVLPRHDDTVYWLDVNFKEPCVWFSESGLVRELEPIKYFEPLIDRACLEVLIGKHSPLNQIVSRVMNEFDRNRKVLHQIYRDIELVFVKEISAIIEFGNEGENIRFDFDPQYEDRVYNLISKLESEGLVAGIKIIAHQ